VYTARLPDLVERFDTHRNARQLENRLAHVHRHADHAAALHGVVDRLDARLRLDEQRPGLLRDQPVLHRELGDATYPVAAHGAFRPVGVEHDHAHCIGQPAGVARRGDHDQSVRADALVAIAHHPGELGQVFSLGNRRLRDGVKVDVVIADAVHFREFEHR